MNYVQFLRDRILPSKFVQLFIQTAMKWQKDECLEMGAALAYYALFSLFPICLVVLSILGFLLGPETDIYAQLLAVAKNILPAEPYKIVKDTLLNLNQSSVGAVLVGFLLLFLTASKIFEALNRSVDKIWGIDSKVETEKKLKHKAIDFLKDKILAFFLVLGTVFVLLISMLSNVAIKVILEVIDQFKNLVIEI